VLEADRQFVAREPSYCVAERPDCSDRADVSSGLGGDDFARSRRYVLAIEGPFGPAAFDDLG
jgi:hypothetical protein